MHRIALLIACLALSVLGLASVAQAGIWTPIASGTTQTITAIEYRSDSQIWYGTAGGQLWRSTGGPFVMTGSAGAPISDIAFDPSGTNGYAVTSTGLAYRTTTAGASWTAVALPAVPVNCDGSGSVAVPALYTILWADAGHLYLGGGNASTIPIILRSTNPSGAGAPTFTEVNHGATDCHAGVGGHFITGSAGTGNPNQVFFANDYFTEIYFSNGAGDPFSTPALSSNGSISDTAGDIPKIAVDPANTQRIWGVVNDPLCSSLCFEHTENGATSANDMTFPNRPPIALYQNLWDVAYNGGTLLAAGASGLIYTSVDGFSAYWQPADGALASVNWKAVALASPTQGLVGGDGGALVKSTTATSYPDLVPPTATIAGPSTAHAGTPTAFTAVAADNPGGSGINPASETWTVAGLPAQTGPAARFTFPAAGIYAVTLNYADNAGNAGTAVTTSINVSAAVVNHQTPTSTTKTTTTTSNGATIGLGVPKACVKAGTTFKVTLSFKRVNKKPKKGTVVFVRVIKTAFYVGTKKVKTVKKAPFVARLTVKAGTKSGSKVTVKAQAQMKVKHPKHGKYPTKSIHTTVTVC